MLHNEKVLGFIWSQEGALPVTDGAVSLVDAPPHIAIGFIFGLELPWHFGSVAAWFLPTLL